MKPKVLIFLTFLFLSSSTFSMKSILLIGDSHTAGYFGKKLHSYIVERNHDLVTLGHASSAPFHWINQKEYYLSGGVYNQATVSNVDYNHPNPPSHWSKKVNVPKFTPLLENMIYHSKWRSKIQNSIIPEFVIIALGANDLGFLGEVGSKKYNNHKKYAQSMVEFLKDKSIPCVWIGPPSGTKKDPIKNNIVYKYLNETVSSYCPLYDSRKYIAECPDGRHFNCKSSFPRANEWARDVSRFVSLYVH
ncbi:hypothetical protein N9N67_00975 [Bacteriovoracaceae bacterium]|nr:hypothetical protein [Bacteriovoracaceae bacterium]